MGLGIKGSSFLKFRESSSNPEGGREGALVAGCIHGSHTIYWTV